MIRIWLIAIGITLLIFVPIVFVASIVIPDIKTQLRNEAPEEMQTMEQSLSNLQNTVEDFLINNWFTIFIVIAIIIIIYILANIYYEIRLKNIIGGR